MFSDTQQFSGTRVTPAIQVGELAMLVVSVDERRGDRLLVSFERDGKTVRKWFRESELTGMGFDDEE